jgi:hypothetical protein
MTQHTQPKVGDIVYDLDRQDQGREYVGTIYYVGRKDHEVGVKYFGGDVVYNGSTVRIGSILYPAIVLVTNPEMKEGGGRRIKYDLSDFEGNWSSHELTYDQDGEGAWLIGGEE